MALKKLGSFAAAGLLVFALAGTASADPVYATVDGHMASTSDNNSADWWETHEPLGLDLSDCTSVNAGQGDLGNEVSTYLLTASYELVVVKAGSSSGDDPNTLTLFANAAAGETVWADYAPGNPALGPGDGDKNISHIIFCDEVATTTTTTTTDTTTTTTDTFTQTVSESTTSSITQPPTDAIGSGGSGNQATGMWLLVAALGVLLGSLVVVAPARAKNKR